jgi:membrane protein required for colicin V production
MNITDYYVIAAVVISAVVGCFRGFLREAIALVTWIIALFIGWHFSESIAPNLGGLLAGSTVATWAARVILVALILLLGAGIGVIAAHYVRLSIFNGMDRFLGFIFGAFRGFVLLGVFVILG